MDEFIEQGIYNSYLVMTGEWTVDEIIEHAEIRSEETCDDLMLPIFFIEPGGEYTNEDIDMMIDVFEQSESYEECAALLKLKTKN